MKSKKIMTAFLAMTMIASFSGCSNSKSANATNNNTSEKKDVTITV